MKTQEEIAVTQYGGIIPIMEELMKRGMPQLFDSILDAEIPRKWNSQYKYSDLFLSWVAASLCGTVRIDQITPKRKHLQPIPNLKLPSHDTIGRMMKQLASKTVKIDRDSKYQSNENYFDDNLLMNRALIEITKSIGALKANMEYTLDVDCTFISTRCHGANSVKGKDQPGFYPMICLIGELPVFISMRNGNSTADFRITECIESCLDLLENAGIKINKVRTDGAGYRQKLVNMLQKRNVGFVTASTVSKTYTAMNNSFDKALWEPVIIETANNLKECEIADISYYMKYVKEPIRVIALKVPVYDKLTSELTEEEREQLKANALRLKALNQKNGLKSSNKRYNDGVWGAIGDYQYKMIATNDFETSSEDLIYFYNQRGEAERQFSFMKNGFGWKYPPFMWMDENTVFYIMTAMANNVFRAMAEIFKEHVPHLSLKATIRRFQEEFINAVAICQNGKWTFYNSNYQPEKNA